MAEQSPHIKQGVVPEEPSQDKPAATTEQDLCIKRALLSVTDKTGIVEFARALSEEFDVEIISTGGTAKVLREHGVSVRLIGELTGFPEMMDGRVKTLHPRVHGGLLARRDLASHREQAEEHAIELIDMVVVNLYAFEATVAKPELRFEEAIENIDIGGPSMLRSAAKNHASVTVVMQPERYEDILAEMRVHGGATTLATRKQLALKVFETTNGYDRAIAEWLAAALDNTRTSSAASKRKEADSTAGADDTTSLFEARKTLPLIKVQDLRYGENPHQKAAFYRVAPDGGNAFTLANAIQVQGKELSYNNYLDLDAAWAAVREFDEPSVVIVKHLTPCGIASDENLAHAYNRAFICDTVSAFGGVMAFNRTVPTEVIENIYKNEQFVEALIAPDYADAAFELLSQKPKIRVLCTGGYNPAGKGLEYRSVEGGLLCMQADAAAENFEVFTVASKRQPSTAEREELLFAWKVCKSVKSNAIVITKDKATIGIGAGQPNRVNSAELAAKQAGEKAVDAVAASDAFMPFADSLEVLAAAGVRAVIQPGGSIRDDEVLTAANAADMVMVFTGMRHFRH